MATLVLTVVGGIIGGPIGAAIGGLVGNAVDHQLLAPNGREGPRLADLSVQTSSYGAPIPKVFGTMRVAGSVIWATDLQEHRSTDGGGKGRPSTTTYSYTASFAVALSSRPILSVGRVWADGNLIRGAAGDWKVATGFRLHAGGEDQAADPLIAAHEGVAAAPAHRGMAYAVFEDLQLADFGNRIPSLTFEVTADSAPPAIAAIAREIGNGAITAEPIPATLIGFSAYGDTTRGVAAMLGQAAGGWFAPTGGGVELRAGSGSAAAISDQGAAAGRRWARATAPIETVPKVLTLAHYDPARDYQAGVQQVRRPGAGVGTERVDLPAALDASAARTLAASLLARRESERVRRTVTLDLEGAGIAAGDRVAIAGEPGLWRVAEARLEGMATTLALLPIAPASLPLPAVSGRVLSAPDVAIGATILHAFELPNLDDTLLTQPRLLLAAAGTEPGWRRAALLMSLDDGASWTGVVGTGAPAVIGTVVSPPAPGPTSIRDLAATIEVELAHAGMTLASADDGAIDRGANLALVGGELLQFGEATQLGATRWRLARLLRGRRGVVADHAAGERFVLIAAETLVALPLPVSAVGRQVRLLASGVGDPSGGVAASVWVSGVSVAPPSPVRLAAAPTADGGAAVTWVRRSRLGWSWRDGGDAPLGEEREVYRVTVTSSAGVRPQVLGAPAATVTAAERTAGAIVAVRQLGTLAESAEATLAIG